MKCLYGLSYVVLSFIGALNMKRVLGFLFAISATLWMATPALAWGTRNDSQEPGSVLVFPLFENFGGNTLPDAPYGQATQPNTSLEISVTCPEGSVCTDHQDVDIHVEWVCRGDASFTCAATDFILNTTVNGTVRFNPHSTVCEPGATITDPEGCGAVATAPCQFGYAIAWVVDESGLPIKFDALIGDAVIRDSPAAVTAYNAIPIQADPMLNTGDFTDLDSSGNHTGTLQFDESGSHYKTVPGQINGSVLYDYINTAGVDQDQTFLVLLTLDVLSNRTNNPTFVDLNFYSETEVGTSASTEFICSGTTILSRLGLNSTSKGPKGLVASSPAVQTPILGGMSVPVTLMGFILTGEFDATGNTLLREFAYPLFNNSTGVSTTPPPTFAP